MLILTFFTREYILPDFRKSKITKVSDIATKGSINQKSRKNTREDYQKKLIFSKMEKNLNKKMGKCQRSKRPTMVNSTNNFNVAKHSRRKN